MSTPTGDQGGTPQYGEGQYGAQAYPGGPGQPAQQPRNGLGIAALVLGILAILTSIFLIGGLLGLIAIILGAIAVSRARKGRATNRGVSIAGIVTGAIGLIITIALVIGGATFFYSTGGGDYLSCVQRAGQDQAQIQQCAQQYSQGIQQQVGGS